MIEINEQDREVSRQNFIDTFRGEFKGVYKDNVEKSSKHISTIEFYRNLRFQEMLHPNIEDAYIGHSFVCLLTSFNEFCSLTFFTKKIIYKVDDELSERVGKLHDFLRKEFKLPHKTFSWKNVNNKMYRVEFFHDELNYTHRNIAKSVDNAKRMNFLYPRIRELLRPPKRKGRI